MEGDVDVASLERRRWWDRIKSRNVPFMNAFDDEQIYEFPKRSCDREPHLN